MLTKLARRDHERREGPAWDEVHDSDYDYDNDNDNEEEGEPRS